MNVALLPLSDASADEIDALLAGAVLRFSDEPLDVAPGGTLAADDTLYRLAVPSVNAVYSLSINVDGPVALFTQHHADEFELEVAGESGIISPRSVREFEPSHTHDNSVTSVGIHTVGDLDPARLNEWLRELLRTQGPGIFRMKGVLSIQGEERRFVFQGVHMLFEGRPDRPWGTEERYNSLIFIGRNLDRAQLNAEFKHCLA
jgi:G3E family GTPase